MEPWPHRRLVAAGVAVAAVATALLILPRESLAATFVDDASVTLAAGLAGVLCFRRARADSAALAWRLLGIGLAFIAAGEAYWLVSDVVLRQDVGTVSAADALYYAGYFFFLAALANWFPLLGGTGTWLRRLLDFVIVGNSLALVAWAFILEDLIALGAADPVGTFLAASYPLLDVAVAAMFLVLAREVPPGARRSLMLVGLGIAVWSSADLAYAYLAVQDAYSSGLALSAAWVAGYLLIAVAASLPATTLAAPESRRAPVAIAWLPYFVAGPAIAVAVALFLLRGDLGQVEEALLLGLILALVARQFIFLRSHVDVGRRLQASEDRLAGILDNQEALIVRVTPDNRITYMNGAYQRAFGLRRGETFWVKVHPDDHAKTQAAMARLQEPPYTCTVEQRCEVAGHWRTIFWQDSVIRDGKGNVAEIQGVGFDVTERRQAEDDLRRQKEMFETTQAVAHVGSWEYDFAADLAWWSQEMFRLFGKDPRTFRPSLQASLDGIHPEDRQVVETAFAKAVADHEPYSLEHRVALPGGGIRWLQERGQVIYDDAGHPLRAVGTAHDVTGRKATEEESARRAALLEQAESIAHLCSWEADLRTGKASWSSGAFGLFGLPPDTPMTYESWLGCIHPEDRDAAKAAADGVVATGQSAEFECRIVRRDTGEVRFTHNRTVPTVVGGKVVHLTGINQDITDAVRARNAQEQLVAKDAEAAQLRKVTAFKTQFLNNAAHELATPITPLKLQIAALRAHGSGWPVDARDALGLLERNINRLGILVNDLVEAARLQSGRLPLNLKEVSLVDVAREACTSLAGQGKQAGVALRMEASADPVVVEGDATRLGQVVFNLVHNALKFTPRGGTVKVEVVRMDGQGVLRVQDDGIGLTEAQMARLFHPFTQVHDVAKLNVGGTGLGLYISRGIIEQHGGTLTCRSDGPGHGTTFEARVPLDGGRKSAARG